MGSPLSPAGPMPLTHPQRFRHLLVRAILLPVGLLLLLVALLWREVDEQLRNQEEARRSQVTLNQVERVRQLLIDRETGVRGYLLTGDSVFLEPYQSAGQRLPQALADLERSLTREEPRLSTLMAQLLERRADWEKVASEELVLFQQRGDWLSIVRSGAGKARMDLLRATLDSITREESQRASRKGQVAQRSARAVLIAGLVWALLVGGVLAWFSRRQLLALAQDYEASLSKVVAQTEALRASEARLEARVAQRTLELTATNEELESFSYSVSHDLRAPLRAIDGFTQALREDEGERMSPASRQLLDRLQAAATRMGQLIDDLLRLSRVTRAELHLESVDLSALAEAVVATLRQREPGRDVTVSLQPGLTVRGDPRLLRVLLENLLENAWKFTSKRSGACIELFTETVNGVTHYAVRDNGVGFDMAHADKLFSPFQRMHKASEFPGTGIGLATVQRIVHRHGGHIQAEAAPGSGATFRFTLQETSP